MTDTNTQNVQGENKAPIAQTASTNTASANNNQAEEQKNNAEVKSEDKKSD